MNLEKLLQEESRFFMHYPDGFADERMKATVKRHDPSKLEALVKEALAPTAFDNADAVLDAVGKVMSRSSLISVFEKTAFRNHVNALSPEERSDLALAVREMLHGNRQKGFDTLVTLLQPYRMAKWPIVTVLLYYSDPMGEVALKPTTVKGVIQTFGLQDLTYNARPTYAFYTAYRDCLIDMKRRCGAGLQVDNCAFSGFLMFAMGLYE